MKTTRADTTTTIRFIKPMYALPVQNIPEGDDWLYEVKFDGYRCLAGRSNNGLVLWSRRGNDFTSQFPLIARACERLPVDTLLDGEIVAIDERGRISFNLLQHHRSNAQAPLFYAFDVIVHRGKSLVNTPLEKRRTVLNEVFEDLGKNASPVCLSETIDSNPEDLIRVAKEVGFEGIVAKRKDSGRTGQAKWRVAPVSHQQRAGVCHRRIHSRQPIRFDYCWLYQDGKLYYAAKVRNGFVQRTRRGVFQRLKGLQVDACPFVNLPKKSARNGG